MPDYTYLKQGIKSVEQEKIDLFRQHQKIYLAEEKQIVEHLVKWITSSIEEAVKEYYRTGRNSHIREEGVFFKSYKYRETYDKIQVGRSYDVIKKGSCIDIEFVYGYAVCVPDEHYLSSLLKKLNEKLMHKVIKLSARSKYSMWLLDVEADLGKL